MGQKINPNGFRLGITTDHVSHWYADSNQPGQRYKDYIREDVKIRELMSTRTRSRVRSISTLAMPARSMPVDMSSRIFTSSRM